MAKGIIGKKVGMTQVFKEDGTAIPVTVILADSCVVTQKKTRETDGYSAVQIGFQDIDKNKVNKAKKGHFAKADVNPKKYLKEFRDFSLDIKVGEKVTVDNFKEGEKVDVTGISKGKGFAGVVKRHHFNTGPKTHGSHFHRAPGSIGAVDAARVFKGQKMPGRMGHEQVTIQNLEIIAVDNKKELLLIKGSVPGPNKSILTIKEAVKG